MKRSLLFWVMGLLASSAWAQSPSPDLRGIYIYTNGLASQTAGDLEELSASFSIPGVDGVAIVVGWGDVEPAMGKYDYTLLDRWIGQVVALGKKIDLVVPAGSNTPAWLFEAPPAGAGATKRSFVIANHNGAKGLCDPNPDIIAAPWDPAFLAQWDAMLAALSAHLKSAGTYSAITLVRLTGINRTSEELRLPAETPASIGLPCVSDAIAIWQQAGYTPSLLLQGWNSVIGSFDKYFHDKSFAVSVIDPPNAFPPIDENGAVIKGTPPDATQPLLLSASQMFPGRLVVQLDFLMPGQAASTEVTNAAQNLATLAAFQTNEEMGDHAACLGPDTDPTPCTDATFLELLDIGIYPLGQSSPLRSQYIEVFHEDAAAFPDDILQAHFQLVPPAISLAANAEGEAPTIAPNTWVEIKGSGLSLTGDSRAWMTSDFVNNQLPARLDSITATVNGKSAFLSYISPTQINILTPPDAMSGPVPVQVTDNGTTTAAFTAQAQPLSPSFFVFNGGPYVVGLHPNGGDIGPATLYPGLTTPAKPGEIVVLYANGFGPTSVPVVSGAVSQSGTLSPLPAIKIGGIAATVQFAGLVSPGLFQFNVVVPSSIADGDQPITATYNGFTTQPGTVITIQH